MPNTPLPGLWCQGPPAGPCGDVPPLCALAGGTRPGGRHQGTLPERQQKLPPQMAALQIPQATSTEAPPSNISKVLLQPLSPGCIPCRLCARQPPGTADVRALHALCMSENRTKHRKATQAKDKSLSSEGGEETVRSPAISSEMLC